MGGTLRWDGVLNAGPTLIWNWDNVFREIQSFTDPDPVGIQNPALDQCWADVADVGTALIQRWATIPRPEPERVASLIRIESGFDTRCLLRLHVNEQMIFQAEVHIA